MFTQFHLGIKRKHSLYSSATNDLLVLGVLVVVKWGVVVW